MSSGLGRSHHGGDGHSTVLANGFERGRAEPPKGFAREEQSSAGRDLSSDGEGERSRSSAIHRRCEIIRRTLTSGERSRIALFVCGSTKLEPNAGGRRFRVSLEFRPTEFTNPTGTATVRP